MSRLRLIQYNNKQTTSDRSGRRTRQNKNNYVDDHWLANHVRGITVTGGDLSDRWHDYVRSEGENVIPVLCPTWRRKNTEGVSHHLKLLFGVFMKHNGMSLKFQGCSIGLKGGLHDCRDTPRLRDRQRVIPPVLLVSSHEAQKGSAAKDPFASCFNQNND